MSAELVNGPEDSPFTFSWTEFSAWFEGIKANQLEPARATFERILKAMLDREMSEFDRHRIRVSTSRVKSPARIWAKLTKDRYRTKVDSLSSIPLLIDDLVGLRVICNNLSDVTRLQEMLAELPPANAEEPYSLAIEPDSEKHYFENPKESGYRAYHLNLVTTVPGLDGSARVRGELQVRTLLQDGWGELTHEDTYKPGVVLPDLVTTIARRMADFLAAVDDLAQDLRDELDRLAEAAVASDEAAQLDSAVAMASAQQETVREPAPISNASREALLQEIRSVVAGLTRPAPLADVAQRVQSKFGTDIVRGWAGFGTFRNLLSAAMPNIVVVGPPPGTVVPPGTPQVDVQNLTAGADSEVPRLARILRSKDRNTPAVGRRKMDQMLREIRDAMRAEVWRALVIDNDGPLGMRDVNKLSRYAREAAAKKGEILSRPQLDYILKALLWNNYLKPDLPLDELRICLTEHFIARARKLQIPVDEDDDRHILQEWLEGADL